MAKKPVKKITMPDDSPVKLNMTFEQAIKIAATTPIRTAELKIIPGVINDPVIDKMKRKAIAMQERETL